MSSVCVDYPSNSFPNIDNTDFNCMNGYRRSGDTCINPCPTGASPDSNGNCVCGGGLILRSNTCRKPI